MYDINQAREIFEKYGIKTSLNKDNLIIISNYSQPKGTTFKELSIDEDELIKNVVATSGIFETTNSALTTFPLEVAQEIQLDEKCEITQMPNLKAVGRLITNSKLKKLPKLKAAGSIVMENSPINALPKLKEAGVLIAQSSALKDLSSLENVSKLCIIDCPLKELKELTSAQDVFICSTNEEEKIEISSLESLEEVTKLFVANSTLKHLPSLKKAEKLAFYNCQVKNIKAAICSDVEIENHISDDELSEKFDTFTDWYNSDILNTSMDLLGGIVNQIKA